MRYEIRPMSFGEILDTGFRLLRNHVVLLVGFAIPIYVPMAYVGEHLQTAAREDPGSAAVAVVPLFLLLSLSPLVSVALAIATADFYLGRSPTFGDVLARTFKAFLPVVGTFFLMGLAIVGGFLLLIVPGIYLMFAFYLVTTVAALEQVYGTRALRRSRELMQGNLWRAVGIIVVSWVALTVLGAGIGMAMRLVPSLSALGSGIAQSLAVAYITAVSVVMYFDIRCRKEAFDLEHLASLVDARGAEAAATAA